LCNNSSSKKPQNNKQDSTQQKLDSHLQIEENREKYSLDASQTLARTLFPILPQTPTPNNYFEGTNQIRKEMNFCNSSNVRALNPTTNSPGTASCASLSADTSSATDSLSLVTEPQMEKWIAPASIPVIDEVAETEMNQISSYLRKHVSVELLNQTIRSINVDKGNAVLNDPSLPCLTSCRESYTTELFLKNTLQLGTKANIVALALIQLKRLKSECRAGATVFRIIC